MSMSNNVLQLAGIMLLLKVQTHKIPLEAKCHCERAAKVVMLETMFLAFWRCNEKNAIIISKQN